MVQGSTSVSPETFMENRAELRHVSATKSHSSFSASPRQASPAPIIVNTDVLESVPYVSRDILFFEVPFNRMDIKFQRYIVKLIYDGMSAADLNV